MEDVLFCTVRNVRWVIFFRKQEKESTTIFKKSKKTQLLFLEISTGKVLLTLSVDSSWFASFNYFATVVLFSIPCVLIKRRWEAVGLDLNTFFFQVANSHNRSLTPSSFKMYNHLECRVSTKIQSSKSRLF